MRYILFLVLLLFATTLSVQAQHEERRSGELIIRLAPEVSVDALQSPGLATLGLVPIRNLVPSLNIWLVGFDEDAHLRAGRSAVDVLSSTRMASDIEVAQFNHVVELRGSVDLANTPNDPRFDEMWGLHNTGQSGGTPGADISALDAWAINTGGIAANGEQVVVAVIDGGFALGHPDVNWWKNENETPTSNGVDTDGNGYIDDYHGWNAYTNSGNITSSTHGTHVAGTIGARGNNGQGVVGIGWDMAVMPIQGSSGNEAIVVAAYGYALTMRQLYNSTNGAQGAFVVAANSSFGVDFGNPANFPIWCGMFDTMGAAGIVSVAATANLGINVDTQGDVPTTCPSDYLISVTNTTRNDVKTTQAGYGTTHIDLGAPGTEILSTWTGNGYSSTSGTSMATPHVAGAVGYLVSAMSQFQLNAYMANPAAGATLVRQAILDGVDVLPSLAGLVATGGRLNLYGALQQLGVDDDPPIASVNPNSLLFTLPSDQTDSQFVTLANLAAPGSQALTYSVTIVSADEAHPAIHGQIHYAASESARNRVVGRPLTDRSAMERIVTARDGHTWWLTHINDGHEPVIYTVTGDGGYVLGTNQYGDTGLATGYGLPFDQTTGLVHGVEIAMVRELPQNMSTYNVVVRSGTVPAGPGAVLYSQPFNVSNIPVGSSGYIWHEFTAPVAVGVNFFISVEFEPPFNLYDLGIVSTLALEAPSPYEFLRRDDMFTWMLLENDWGSSWHMYKYVEVELPDLATPPITISPTSGTVEANDSIQLEITANSEGLDSGTYEYVAQIITNDPDSPLLTVDVTLVVTGTEEYSHTISAAGGAGWRMLSSPMFGATVQNLANANLVYGIPDEYPNTDGINPMVGYDGEDFVSPSGLSHPLVPGKGFIWYLWDTAYPIGHTPPSGGGNSQNAHLPFDLTFTGSPVVENHFVQFTEAERAGDDDGWYLIGNPYQESYNVRGIVPSTGGFSGTFQHWDAAENAYVPLNRFDDDEADIGAGFFMQFVHQPTLPATITFGPAGGGPPPPPSDMVEYFTARFELTGELLVAYGGNHIPVEVSDRHTRVIFSEEATDDFDMLDAGKLTPLSYYWANIAMMGMQGDETVRRSIESRPLPQSPVTIPVTIPVTFSTYAAGQNAAGTFTIALSENTLGAGWEVSLHDLETGETVNMLTGSYTFNIESQPAIDADERFEITFTPPTVSGEGSGEALAFGLEAVWPNPTAGTAQVRFALEAAGEISLEMFDVLGRRVALVASGEYAAGRHVLPLNTSDLASGVYVVRLMAGSQTVVQRVTVAR